MLWKLNFIINLEFWIQLQSFKWKIENKNIFTEVKHSSIENGILL
jgi:hypothetical protein